MDEAKLARYRIKFEEDEASPQGNHFISGYKKKYSSLEEREDRFERYCRKLELLEDFKLPITGYDDSSTNPKFKKTSNGISGFAIGIIIISLSIGFIFTVLNPTFIVLIMAIMGCMFLLAISKTKKSSTYCNFNKENLQSSFQVNSLIDKYQPKSVNEILDEHFNKVRMDKLMEQQKEIADRQLYYLKQLSDPYSASNQTKRNWNW
jgi:hypothetical protein